VSAPIINQPWEDVADDVTGAIEKAVQPLLKKAVDDIYAGLLDTTQDYLRDNLAFNIAERINAAERQADYDRWEAAQLREANAFLLAALEQVARPYGMLDLAVSEHMHGPRGDDMLAAAKVVRAAIAKSTGEAA
jgi:hypothetical protein